tara:strand:+ start:4263 stop:4850 length:588 start_codon:yes stop_codon:yes gene_type:complete
MNNPLKNIVILAVILVGLFFLTTKNENSNFTKSNFVYKGDKDNIAKIMIQQGDNMIQLNRVDTTWEIAGIDTLVIRENRIDDFFEKVLNVKRTTIRSKKESNWLNYSVDDSTGTHLVLIDDKDDSIGSYIFGRSKTDWAHNFVRLKDQNESTDILKNVYETSESVIHHLNTSATYWGEKLPELDIEGMDVDSLGN